MYGLTIPPASRQAKTKQQLLAIADPQSLNQPEALPWFWYSRKAYVDNTTTTLSFFDTIETNKAISNMQAGSSMPSPMYFEIYSFGADVLRNTSANAAAAQTGAIDDVLRLWHTSEAFWQFTISDKNFGPFPTSVLHPSGGIQPFGFGTTTADTGSVQWANNGPYDGGFPVAGALVIKPKINFVLTVTWPAAVDLVANINVRVWMWGILHRRVL